MRGTGKEKKEVNKMMFRKAISLFTAGVMMAGMFAAGRHVRSYRQYGSYGSREDLRGKSKGDRN